MQEPGPVIVPTPVYDSASTTSTTVASAGEPVVTRPIDLVRWGSVIAGLFAALATLIVLSVLGVAIGLGQFQPGDNLANLGLGAGIWGAVSVLIAFFVGGWLAAGTAAVTGSGNGVLHGMMVWCVAITLLVFALGSGIGALVGATVNNAAQVVGQVTGNPTLQATAVTTQTVQNATTAVSNTAWGTLLALALAALAALLGGALGARPGPLRQLSVSRTVTRT